jgi:hypothetical protein
MKLCCLQENNGTGDYHVKQNKPDSESFLSYVESRPKKNDINVKGDLVYFGVCGGTSWQQKGKRRGR